MWGGQQTCQATTSRSCLYVPRMLVFCFEKLFIFLFHFSVCFLSFFVFCQVCDFLQNVILKTMDVQEAARHAVTSTRILKVCRPCLCINIDNLVPA